MRTRSLVLLAALALAGCRRDPQPRPQPSAPKEDAAPSSAARPGAAPTPPETFITPELVERYFAYEKADLAATLAFMGEAKARNEELEHDHSAIAEANALSGELEAARELELRQARARTEVGLSEREAADVKDVVSEVFLVRAAWRQAGGDRLLIDLEAREALIPVEDRAAFRARMAAVDATLTRLRDATGAREKYGDDVVDAILKHESDLEARRQKMQALVR